MEIFFSDLTEDAQARVLSELGLKDAKDGNFDIAPLFVLEVEA